MKDPPQNRLGTICSDGRAKPCISQRVQVLKSGVFGQHRNDNSLYRDPEVLRSLIFAGTWVLRVPCSATFWRSRPPHGELLGVGTKPLQ